MNVVFVLDVKCFLGGGPVIELIPDPGRSSMSLCGQRVCDPENNLSENRGSVKFEWREGCMKMTLLVAEKTLGK